MFNTWNEEIGWALPLVKGDLPGKTGTALVDLLAKHESPGITARRSRQGESRGLSRDPIVWTRALGGNVWDADGNRFVDLTGGFGVASIGHGHPAVQEAIVAQSKLLLHGMGDVFPNNRRIELMAELARLAPEGLSMCILAGGGAEAVEVSLKTAALASKKPGVLAFWNAYHGLSYGALAATAYQRDFRKPFLSQLGPHVQHLPYGVDPAIIDELLGGVATGGEGIGAILLEPIQGRGGTVEAPEGWLRALREIADRHQVMLIFDEIYSGLGRTGDWWALEKEGIIPDILVAGKSLGGGLPIGVSMASEKVMRAWKESQGEAIHTSTFLGNPLVAAASLATLQVMKDWDIRSHARAFEAHTRAFFEARGLKVRGRGGMLAIEMGDAALVSKVVGQALNLGFLVLPGGVKGDMIGLTPPLMLSEGQREAAFQAIYGIYEREHRGQNEPK